MYVHAHTHIHSHTHSSYSTAPSHLHLVRFLGSRALGLETSSDSSLQIPLLTLVLMLHQPCHLHQACEGLPAKVRLHPHPHLRPGTQLCHHKHPSQKRHVYHPFWKRHSLKHCSLTSCAQLLSTPAIGPIPQAAQRTQASTARHPHSHRPPVAGCTGWKGVTACSSPGISSLFTQPRSHRPPVARCTGWKGTNSITSSITNSK
eukprot:scaffold178992_cov18-Tisochrysis_lutea.AAC.1